MTSEAVLTPEEIVLKAALHPEEHTPFVLYTQLLEQAHHELKLMMRVPEMKRQRKMLKGRIGILDRCLAASKAGFAEFHPSQSWSHGFLSVPRVRNRMGRMVNASGGYQLYTRPLPAVAIEAYIKARDLGVFDLFTVHSPEQAAFKDYAQQISTTRATWNGAAQTISKIRLDPVLIGWINVEPRSLRLSDEWNGTEEAVKSDVKHPFLIAAWDLNKDLAYSQLQIAAPRL